MGMMGIAADRESGICTAVREGLHAADDRTALWGEILLRPPADEVRRAGPDCLFRQARFANRRLTSPAFAALHAALTVDPEVPVADRDAAAGMLEAWYEPLAERPWPWLRTRSTSNPSRLATVIEGTVLAEELPADLFGTLSQTQRSTALLLMLPFLEHVTIDLADVGVGLFEALLYARKNKADRAAAIEQVREWALRSRAHDRVVAWINADAASTMLYS
jgi:hypothetical protein